MRPWHGDWGTNTSRPSLHHSSSLVLVVWTQYLDDDTAGVIHYCIFCQCYVLWGLVCNGRCIDGQTQYVDGQQRKSSQFLHKNYHRDHCWTHPTHNAFFTANIQSIGNITTMIGEGLYLLPLVDHALDCVHLLLFCVRQLSVHITGEVLYPAPIPSQLRMNHVAEVLQVFSCFFLRIASQLNNYVLHI